MGSQSKSYAQGLAAAKSGKGKFSGVPRAERTEFYHRSIVLARIFADPHGAWVLKGGTTPSRYEEALAIAKNLLDPAISGEAIGKVWREQAWH